LVKGTPLNDAVICRTSWRRTAGGEPMSSVPAALPAIIISSMG
jgi:hypothetical protein